MLASASAEGVIKLWSPSTGACLATLNPAAGGVARAAFTPDGRWLLSAHENGTLGLWDLHYYDAHIANSAAYHATP